MTMEGATGDVGLFVGIDWATEEHQVCILDPTGKVRWEGKVAHDGESLAGLVARLRGLDEVHRIAVSIERPDGAVVDTMLDAGIAVYALNPKQLDRFRDRFTNAGAKDDRRDAYVLAHSLITDRSLFRRVQALPEERLLLRELSRLHDELTADKVRLTNQARDQLLRYFPQVLLLKAMEEEWLWEVLELVPTPTDARKASQKAIAGVLGRHRIRRVTAKEVLAVLRQPALTVAPGVPEAASCHLRSSLARLHAVQRELDGCDARIASVLKAACRAEEDALAKGTGQRDTTIVLSLPGVGPQVGATLLGEASQALQERDYRRLRALCGVAPVTGQTGKQRSPGQHGAPRQGPKVRVAMRRACSGRLRNAISFMAMAAVRNDAHCDQLYRAARARGVSHNAALRSVADRLLDVLVAMLRTGSVYDASRWPIRTAAAA